MPRRTCGREPSRATHDCRRRGGLTLDAVARDGAMAKRVRRHVKPITTTRPTTRPAAPPSAPGWSRSRSRFPPHRFLEGGVGKASRTSHGALARDAGMEENAGRHRFIAHSHHVYYKPSSPHLSACRRPRTPRRPTGSMAMIAGVVEASLSMHSLVTPRWRSIQDATLTSSTIIRPTITQQRRRPSPDGRTAALDHSQPQVLRGTYV